MDTFANETSRFSDVIIMPYVLSGKPKAHVVEATFNVRSSPNIATAAGAADAAVRSQFAD